MGTQLLHKLEKLELRAKAIFSEEALKYISMLPKDFLDFILNHDGGVGFLGKNCNYIELWSANNIATLNPYYPTEEFCQEIVIIGTDGGGTLYGFDIKTESFFESDVFQLTREQVKRRGRTFLDFISFLETHPT